MNLWFTSDNHFWHKHIIEYSKRPFSSIEEMNQVMIERWNETVRADDMVIHLGDLSFGTKAKTRNLMDQLNGVKILIWGNHDPRQVRKLPHWTWVGNEYRTKELYLCHFPSRTWGSGIHLHGHSHGAAVQIPNRMDVGVDCWDFRPVSLTQIHERMKKQLTLEGF